MKIEFNGTISEENQISRIKRVNKTVIFVFTISLILLWVTLIILDMIFGYFLQELWKEFVICSIIILFVALLSAKTPEKVTLRFKLSPHIIITENELSLELWKDGKKMWRKQKISKVKNVLDCGNVYYIIFRFGDITNAWICQKNNITNGTIEDFETLFNHRIIREFNQERS